MRKAELTALPIIPPTVLKLSNREDTAAAVAATTMDVMMTILVVVPLSVVNPVATEWYGWIIHT